ncbi:MAG: hypothetical protein ACJAYU_004306 [Bradymonadia bacterium]|jgi:hypothetical protein
MSAPLVSLRLPRTRKNVPLLLFKSSMKYRPLS